MKTKAAIVAGAIAAAAVGAALRKPTAPDACFTREVQNGKVVFRNSTPICVVEGTCSPPKNPPRECSK